jgi:hypothetical protein
MFAASDSRFSSRRSVLRRLSVGVLLTLCAAGLGGALGVSQVTPAHAQAPLTCASTAPGLVSCVTYVYPSGHKVAGVSYPVSISWERCPVPGQGSVWVPSQNPFGLPTNC